MVLRVAKAEVNCFIVVRSISKVAAQSATLPRAAIPPQAGQKLQKFRAVRCIDRGGEAKSSRRTLLEFQDQNLGKLRRSR